MSTCQHVNMPTFMPMHVTVNRNITNIQYTCRNDKMHYATSEIKRISTRYRKQTFNNDVCECK